MENGQPSYTALAAAAARAAHLIVDAQPWIFADTLAEAVLGDRAAELAGYHCARPTWACCSTAVSPLLASPITLPRGAAGARARSHRAVAWKAAAARAA